MGVVVSIQHTPYNTCSLSFWLEWLTWAWEDSDKCRNSTNETVQRQMHLAWNGAWKTIPPNAKTFARNLVYGSVYVILFMHMLPSVTIIHKTLSLTLKGIPIFKYYTQKIEYWNKSWITMPLDPSFNQVIIGDPCGASQVCSELRCKEPRFTKL